MKSSSTLPETYAVELRHSIALLNNPLEYSYPHTFITAPVSVSLSISLKRMESPAALAACFNLQLSKIASFLANFILATSLRARTHIHMHTTTQRFGFIKN